MNKCRLAKRAKSAIKSLNINSNISHYSSFILPIFFTLNVLTVISFVYFVLLEKYQRQSCYLYLILIYL